MLARDYPERVSALILLAPAAALTRMPYLFYPLKLPGLGPLLALLLGPWIVPFALGLAYHRRELITPEVVAGYAAPFREPRRRLALASLCRQAQIPPLAEIEVMLAQLRPPVTIIWGEGDRILPVSHARWLKDRLPRAEMHVLPEVGHAPQEEAPQTVNEIIIDFLIRSINN
jgi:pimeloyl-ACP methyl ester carboxylesterase